MAIIVKAKCSINDCFHCPYDDCIADIQVRHSTIPTQATRDKASKRMKEKRRMRRESHCCTWCGAKLPDSYKYKNCEHCRARMRAYQEKCSRRKGIPPRDILDGLEVCKKCGKYPPFDGHKLCKRCYDNAINFLDKTPTHNERKLDNYFTTYNEVFYQCRN